MKKIVFFVLCFTLVACDSENEERSESPQTSIGGESNSSTNNNTSTNNLKANNGMSNSNTTSNNTPVDNGGYTRLIKQGSDYFGSSEKFNAYYTDPNWTPKRVIYVAMDGGDGFDSQSYESPIGMETALSNLEPGDFIFVKATSGPISDVNIRVDSDQGGTYEQPVVFYGERRTDGSLGVHLECATSGSNANTSCFNLEASNYIAIDGFIMEGGNYGVRAVGAYETSGHQLGVAMLNNHAFDQEKDPLFSGGSDWLVVESNICHGAKEGDGHGLYLSNGSDWNIVRFNELYDNVSSDFQVNADPLSTCDSYSDDSCHGSANDRKGDGVSEFFTIMDNFFHDGKGQGPNFTSMRNSKVSNNIFGPYERHNLSFWQETEEAKLGSSNNEFENNLLVGFKSHLLQFKNNSNGNRISGNILMGLNKSGSEVDTSVVAIEVENSSNNTYADNFYFTGLQLGHALEDSEVHSDKLPSDLFRTTSFARVGHPEDWTPKTGELGGWKPPQLHVFPSPYTPK